MMPEPYSPCQGYLSWSGIPTGEVIFNCRARLGDRVGDHRCELAGRLAGKEGIPNSLIRTLMENFSFMMEIRSGIPILPDSREVKVRLIERKIYVYFVRESGDVRGISRPV
jgi:hypothetical protein